VEARKMSNVYLVCALILGIGLSCHAVSDEAAAAASLVGEQAFVKHCSVCHPKGGNIINPAKTLQKKVLAANGIQKPADIVAKIRKPGTGMTPFDEKAIPDETAKAIAEYVLETFK
jgi:cytochrome c6